MTVRPQTYQRQWRFLPSHPPVGDVPVVLQHIRVGLHVLRAVTDGDDVDACIKGDEVDLVCQLFEEAVIVLHALCEWHGVAAQRQGLVDDGVLYAPVVAQVGLSSSWNLGRMKDAVFVVWLRAVLVAEHGEVKSAGCQDAAPAIDGEELAEGIIRNLHIDAYCVEIALDERGDGGADRVIGGGDEAQRKGFALPGELSIGAGEPASLRQ